MVFWWQYLNQKYQYTLCVISNSKVFTSFDIYPAWFEASNIMNWAQIWTQASLNGGICLKKGLAGTQEYLHN